MCNLITFGEISCLADVELRADTDAVSVQRRAVFGRRHLVTRVQPWPIAARWVL